MVNEVETKKLLAVSKRLNDEKDMIGWLCTVYRNKVFYSNSPEETRRIQEQLNRASTLISLAYIWALLDESGFDENNEWISPQDRDELKAWKHVRHTGAHAPGTRALRYKNEFDTFMQDEYAGVSGLRQNCTFTDNTINLRDGMGYQFFTFILDLTQKAIGNCAGNREPK